MASNELEHPSNTVENHSWGAVLRDPQGRVLDLFVAMSPSPAAAKRAQAAAVAPLKKIIFFNDSPSLSLQGTAGTLPVFTIFILLYVFFGWSSFLPLMIATLAGYGIGVNFHRFRNFAQPSWRRFHWNSPLNGHLEPAVELLDRLMASTSHDGEKQELAWLVSQQLLVSPSNQQETQLALSSLEELVLEAESVDKLVRESNQIVEGTIAGDHRASSSPIFARALEQAQQVKQELAREQKIQREVNGYLQDKFSEDDS